MKGVHSKVMTMEWAGAEPASRLEKISLFFTMLQFQAQQKAARAMRYSHWIKGYNPGQKQWYNFFTWNYFWSRTIQPFLLRYLEADNPPPANPSDITQDALAVYREYRRELKSKGMDTSIKNITFNSAYKKELFVWSHLRNRLAVQNQLEYKHEMFHQWGMPSSLTVSFMLKYVALGLFTGTLAALWWRYRYDMPLQRHYEAYYRQLYEEHPELWPQYDMTTSNNTSFRRITLDTSSPAYEALKSKSL